jgi:nucleotidyltransferase substrate binding protein (TIGR01987 family)
MSQSELFSSNSDSPDAHLRLRLLQRFEQFSSALNSLERVMPRALELNELEQDGLLQRFEFTFELAWKQMQDYLNFIGEDGIKGPKPVLAAAAKLGLIEPMQWGEMLVARNRLTHVYSAMESRLYVQAIIHDFFPALRQFHGVMLSHLANNVTK